MAEMRAAISAARGRTLPPVSKASDRKICMPPTRSSGKKTIATTMIPTPPNHCSIDRQRSSPSGRSSSFTKTVAPVVVMPDIASNTASTTRASVAPMMKGTAPNSGSATQTAVARRKVCCTVSRARTPLAQDNASNTPVPQAISALVPKDRQWSLPW